MDKSNQPTPSKPIINRRQIAVTQAGHWLETNEAKRALLYAPWFVATLSLPYSDPGADVGVWERTNGNTTIQIVPQYVDGEYRHPFGAIPRLLLIWMCTQATKSKSPEIEVSDSLAAFLQEIGVAKGGKQMAIVRDQMERLFNAGIRIITVTETKKVRHVQQKNFFIFDDIDVLFTRNTTDGQLSLWGSTISLSDKFYEQIKGHSFPLKAEAVRAVAGSTFAADIYFFLVYRLHEMKNLTRITWVQLADQFGSQYKEPRDFKKAFIRAMDKVTVLYPEAHISIEKKCLVLHPSKPHVPKGKGRASS